MKKNEIEKLDKLNEEKKLTKEVKNKIAKKSLNNFLIALDILLLFSVFIISSRNLPKEIVILIYKISSVVLLIFTIVVFEIAYKKDKDEFAIYGIEMLVLSIITLLTPYIFIEKPTTFSLLVGVYFTVYYMLKNFIIYKKEKEKYLTEQSDIKQIIKKESQDELAKVEKVKLTETETETPKRKRGRPPKRQLSR